MAFFVCCRTTIYFGKVTPYKYVAEPVNSSEKQQHTHVKPPCLVFGNLKLI